MDEIPHPRTQNWLINHLGSGLGYSLWSGVLMDVMHPSSMKTPQVATDNLCSVRCCGYLIHEVTPA